MHPANLTTNGDLQTKDYGNFRPFHHDGWTTTNV